MSFLGACDREKRPALRTPDGGLLWDQKAMNTNEYAAEKRIAQKQTLDSRNSEQAVEETDEAREIGGHLIIEDADWVPGKHPDPNRRRQGQTEYLEQYLRCIQCGVEVLSKRDLPEECDAL